MDIYKEKFLNNAIKLDAVINNCGEITKLANAIVDDNSKESIILFLKKISNIIKNESYSNEVKRIASLVNSNLIEYLGYKELESICQKDSDSCQDNRSLDELLKDLNSLVGLDSVKEKVSDLIAFQKVNQLRKLHNLHSKNNTLHMAFIGNPGTGKTTVARIVGRVYKQLGLLSKGHFIEASRTDLIAGYQGQTALKVKAVIEKAKGGVLFIDEAYSITENEHSDSYGRECLTELTKALEDYRDDLVVIVAGYTEPMQNFFESNPGLKSRFNTFIEFPNYSANELIEIFRTMCEYNDYRIDPDLELQLNEYFSKAIENPGDNFSNGRFVRNLFEDIIMNHARRVSAIENASVDDLSIVKSIDFIDNV